MEKALTALCMSLQNKNMQRNDLKGRRRCEDLEEGDATSAVEGHARFVPQMFEHAAAVPTQFPCQGTLMGLQGRRKRNHPPSLWFDQVLLVSHDLRLLLGRLAVYCTLMLLLLRISDGFT